MGSIPRQEQNQNQKLNDMTNKNPFMEILVFLEKETKMKMGAVIAIENDKWMQDVVFFKLFNEDQIRIGVLSNFKKHFEIVKQEICVSNN